MIYFEVMVLIEGIMVCGIELINVDMVQIVIITHQKIYEIVLIIRY